MKYQLSTFQQKTMLWPFLIWKVENHGVWSAKTSQNSWKTIPFAAAHTYIAHKREYTPPREVFQNPTSQAVSIFLNFCPIVPSFVFVALPKYSFIVFKWLSLYFTQFDDHFLCQNLTEIRDTVSRSNETRSCTEWF